MKQITLKILGLFMGIFATSQFFYVGDACAKTPPKITKQVKTKKTFHDTGCACVSCMQSAQTTTQSNPTKKNGIKIQ